MAVSEAMRSLELNLSVPDHEFWPLEYGNQLTDALLLDLAIRRGGRLATFDRRLESLLAASSAHRPALEILPAE